MNDWRSHGKWSDQRDILLRLRDPEASEACLEDERAMLDAADEIELLRELLREIASFEDIASWVRYSGTSLTKLLESMS